MRLDPEALEAAGEVYLSEQVEMQAPGQLDWATSELSSAIQAYLAVADLVPRSMLDAEIEGLTRAQRYQNEAQDERDKARKEAEERLEQLDNLKFDIGRYISIAAKETDLAETQGRQLAALRVALDTLLAAQHLWNLPSHWDDEREKLLTAIDEARAVLTDTGEAAAQWVRVDNEHVVIEAAVLEPFIKYIKSSDGPVTQFHAHGQSETGPGISADVPDDFTLSKPSPEIHGITLGDFRALARAAAPKAGEPEDEV